MAKKKREPDNFVEMNETKYAILGVDVSEGRVNHRSASLEMYVQKVMNEEICRDVLVQRLEGQWTNKKKSELIVSILQNRPIGSILITSERIHEAIYMSQAILDGLQRTDAMCGYLNNKYALSKNTKPLQCVCKSDSGETIKYEIEIAGKKFSQLPPALQRIIRNYDISMYEYSGFTDDELDDIIYNINNGVSFKPNQKLRLAFGTNTMKYIQPICENAIWDNVNGCNAKNDSILGCITRTMMIMMDCDCDLSAGEMNNFAEEFDINDNMYIVKRIGKLFDRLNDIISSSKFSEEDIEFFNACNIPHIVEALDGWTGTDEQFIGYLVNFLNSDSRLEYDKYAATKSGSGAKQYSYESVSSRRGVILNAMTDYIADNNIEGAESNEETDTVDSTDNIEDSRESNRPDGEGESEKSEQLLYENSEGDERGQGEKLCGCNGDSDDNESPEQYSEEWSDGEI